MKAIYVIFFLIFDAALYYNLNHKNKVSPKTFWLFIGAYFIVALVHSGLFKLAFLMPFGNFLFVSQFWLQLLLFHFVGVWYIRMAEKSKLLTREAVELNVRLTRFIFLRAMYFIVFLLQLVFINRNI